MEEIGIRELKARASEVVRAVKECRARYIITQLGAFWPNSWMQVSLSLLLR